MVLGYLEIRAARADVRYNRVFLYRPNIILIKCGDGDDSGD